MKELISECFKNGLRMTSDKMLIQEWIATWFKNALRMGERCFVELVWINYDFPNEYLWTLASGASCPIQIFKTTLEPILLDFDSLRGSQDAASHGQREWLIIDHRSYIIDYGSSIINYRSSIINHQSSIINHRSSTINHRSSIIDGCQRMKQIEQNQMLMLNRGRTCI